MNEHEMADELDVLAKDLAHVGDRHGAEMLAVAAAMLRAVPTRDQKIEALKLASDAGAIGINGWWQHARRSASCARQALRLLGLDDQETP